MRKDRELKKVDSRKILSFMSLVVKLEEYLEISGICEEFVGVLNPSETVGCIFGKRFR